MPDLEDFKEKWAEQDRKIEAGLQLNRRLLTAVHLKDARSAMDRLTALLALHAAAWLAAAVALGSFIYAHAASPRLALCAAAIDLYAIAMLAALVRQIAAARAIDYAGPIAQIQARIEALRVLRIRFVRWALLAGTILWAPAAAVVLGIDNPAWLAANIAFGLALIPLTLWLAHRFAGRASQSPFLASLLRDIAGHSLSDAAAFLASLAEFEAGDLAR